MPDKVSSSSYCISHVSLGIDDKHLNLYDINLDDTSALKVSNKVCSDSGNIMGTIKFHCLVTLLNSNDSSNLWHIQLGHPSTNLLIKFLRL